MEPKKSTFDISRLLLDTVNTYEETAVPCSGHVSRILCASPPCSDPAAQRRCAAVWARFFIRRIRMTVFYVPEGGGLRKLDIPVSFAHIEEAQDINERCQLFASCRVVSAVHAL